MSKYWYDRDQLFGSIPMERILSTSGLELARGMVEGAQPAPTICRALNFYMAGADEGRVVFKGTPLDEHYNPAGTVHGGWTAAILDSSLACCVWTRVPVGFVYTTVEFKVNIVRPMTDRTGEVICEGNVVHMGRKLATSQATLRTQEGKLIAHASETCAILDPKS